jgi:hypothetical protein
VAKVALGSSTEGTHASRCVKTIKRTGHITKKHPEPTTGPPVPNTPTRTQLSSAPSACHRPARGNKRERGSSDVAQAGEQDGPHRANKKRRTHIMMDDGFGDA